MEFRRRKVESIELGPTYVHELVTPEMSSGPFGDQGPASPFKLTASRAGVRLEGKLDLPNVQALRAFAKVISDAQKDAEKFRPNLTANLAGH